MCVLFGVVKEKEERGNRWGQRIVKHSHISVVGVALTRKIGQGTDPCARKLGRSGELWQRNYTVIENRPVSMEL